jgi:hypothetical protein
MAQFEPTADKRACTTISIHKSTKNLLDRIKAPGQNYNGIICQLVDLWTLSERNNTLNRILLNQSQTSQKEGDGIDKSQ